MRPGYQNLYKPLTEFLVVVRINNIYYPSSALNKATSEIWKVSRMTKYRILHNPDKWEELEVKTGIGIYIAAPLYDKHLIVSNGDVLNKNTLTLVCDNGLSVVRFTDAGDYFSLYRANIVYRKFIDPNHPLESNDIFYLDMNINNADIGNIMLKDGEQASRKKKHRPKQHWAEKEKEYGKYD